MEKLLEIALAKSREGLLSRDLPEDPLDYQVLFHFLRQPDGTLVTVWLTVPDADTGKPFELPTSELIPAGVTADFAVTRCFRRALEHECDEGLVINAMVPDPH